MNKFSAIFMAFLFIISGMFMISTNNTVKAASPLQIQIRKPSNAESVRFWAVNPEDSTDTKEITTDGISNYIPKNYELHGEILMNPGKVLLSSGNPELDKYLFNKDSVEELSKQTSTGGKTQKKLLR